MTTVTVANRLPSKYVSQASHDATGNHYQPALWSTTYYFQLVLCSYGILLTIVQVWFSGNSLLFCPSTTIDAIMRTIRYVHMYDVSTVFVLPLTCCVEWDRHEQLNAPENFAASKILSVSGQAEKLKSFCSTRAVFDDTVDHSWTIRLPTHKVSL